MLQVLWFKRDLRIADHAPLAQAAAAGPVLPLYLLEPELWQQPDASGRHWAFARESLIELRAQLAALGQPLVIRRGNAVEVFEALRQSRLCADGTFALWSHQETGNGWSYVRDRAVGAWARAHGIVWTELPQHGVIRRLASRNGWARRWDAQMAAPIAVSPTALPALAPCDVDVGSIPPLALPGLAEDDCPGRQQGGRAAGLRMLTSFVTERGAAYHRELSSPSTAAESCSRLSVHLAWGTISMREAAQAASAQLARLQALPVAERGTWPRALRAFIGRLHWHCHFMQKLESEPRLEFANTHRAYDGLREAEFDEARFQAWCEGRTGLPFVDACMRSLIATGWLNFRMRAMLCAVSSYHLWLHWRQPALHLARLFTDYEPGIHYPQMQMQSGVTGINTIRIYNPVKQGLDHDADGSFIRRWIPELAGVADAAIHTPWRLDASAQAAAGVVIGQDYPQPIVDPAAAARSARDRVWAVRQGAAFHRAADAIQDRHGSRKAGLPPTRATAAGTPRRRKGSTEGKPAPAEKPRPQLGFDFGDHETPAV